MSAIISILLGIAGATVANKIGVNSFGLDWVMVCFPWWMLAAAINYIVYD